MKTYRFVALCVAGVFLATGAAQARTLGTSARQLPKGSLKLLMYYEGTSDQDVNFNVTRDGSCSVVTVLNPGGVNFACGQSGELTAEGSGDTANLKLIYQPWEIIQYYATIGVGDYSLRVPSTTITNLLTGDNLGMTFTVGFKGLILPDTIVSPGVALDVSVSHSRHHFNRRFPGGTPGVSGNIDQRFDLLEYQVAMVASHVFVVVEKEELDLVALKGGVKLEPYGGVKWSRLQTDLKDLISGDHVGGSRDTVTPFLGLRIPMFEHEGFFAEASFVGGYQYSAGMEIRF